MKNKLFTLTDGFGSVFLARYPRMNAVVEIPPVSGALVTTGALLGVFPRPLAPFFKRSAALYSSAMSGPGGVWSEVV